MPTERPSTVAGARAWTTVVDDVDRRILPDGCMDLMWLGGRLVVAGPDSVATTTTVPAGSRVTGVSLPPGIGPALLGVPAHAVRDARPLLADLWGEGAVRPLEDAVAGAADPGLALEAVLRTHGRGQPTPDPLLVDVVRRARRGDGVATIAADVGLSARQLHRRSLDAFGYGPKLLARILRLTRALDTARAGTDLATVAAEQGYADQAHLARDVRSLTGTTLTGLGLGLGGAPG